MARILIVDDERSIRRTLGEFLREDRHEVVEAEDADVALQRLHEAGFDVVVSDIILPRITGVELLRRIHGIAPHVQVIMMTGEPTVETASEALRAGAVDYLFKPITKAAILRVVANAARIKSLDDTKRRLEAENRAYQEDLERLVNERTAQLRASEERAVELSRFNQAALDALTAHICVLAEDGTILAVNEAWRAFAAANPPRPANADVGANYLAACEAVVGEEAAAVQDVVRGLRAVAHGDMPEFSLEYPCHSPDTQRWFMLRATRFAGAGPVRIVIAHLNISERKLTEARLDCFARLGHLLSTATTPQQAAQIMADAASDLLGWDACYLSLVSLEEAIVTPLINIDTMNGKRVAVALPETVSQPTPMFRRVLTEGAQLILRERPEEADPQLTPTGDLTRRSLSLMFVPIRREGQPIGVFSVQSYQIRAYNAADLETLQALADHGTGALVRLQATAALQESEERFRSLYENALMGLYRTTPDGRILLANPALVRMLGYRSFEELARKNLETQGFHPDYPRHTFKEAVEQHDMLRGLESAWTRADGTTVFVREDAQAVRDQRGRILYYDGVVEDITERKRAEAEARDRQAELTTIFENSPVMMCLLDADHQMRRLNHTLAQFAGRSAAELLNQRIGGFLGCVHAAESPAGCGFTPHCPACPLLELVQKTFQTGQDHRQVESRCVLSRGGQPKERSLTCATARLDVDGQPMVLLCLEDVTEKRLTEAKLLRAQRVESIGSLASGIAHDLNNILTPIIMCAPMLQMDEPDAERRELAQTIESSAHRAVEIVKQLLSFARGKEGQKATLQVRHLVRDMAKIARETFPRSIQVEEMCAPDLWPVVADATQLHQVVLNLCVNARDAMPSGGKLTVRADNVTLDEHYGSMHKEAMPGPFVRIQVADTGTGIPDAVRDRIFESFFTTKGEDQGTGLGLTTVQGIVRDHKGFITFTSAPGRGTTFVVHLPAVPEAQALAETAQSREAIPRGQGELVLVVDDEPAICDTTRRTLERNGYAVLQAHDGIEALAQFSAHQAEVRAVITDFMMPLMDGVTLCRTLRALTPHTPVIVSSGGLFGKPGVDALRTFEELGIRHILSKPHTAGVLLRTLAEVVRPPPGSGATGKTAS